MTAMADRLAELLSERTGAHWQILRGRVTEPRWDAVARRHYPSKPVMRYGLRITRGEYSHTFQAHRPMKLGELTRWLASICDMVDMGFLTVRASSSVADKGEG